jgi:hypothetical protein
MVKTLLFSMFLGGAQAATESVLFTHVNVIPMLENVVLEDRFVLVADGVVKEIARSGDLSVPPGTRVVEARGQYLIPGLIDMHVHFSDRADLDHYLVRGVTAIRVARGAPRFLRWRDAVVDGALRGPRLSVASPYIWDRGPDVLAFEPKNTKHVRELVRAFDQDGYDAYKLVDSYNAEVTLALMDEVARTGKPLFGHVPDDSEAFDYEWTVGLGMHSIEHLDEVVRLALGYAPSETEIEAFVTLARDRGVVFTSLLGGPVRAAKILERIARGEPAYSEAMRERVLANSGWNDLQRLDEAAEHWESFTPEKARQHRVLVELTQRVLKELVEAGVTVLPGTEGAGRGGPAGETLLLELEIFREAGLSRFEVLRAATRDAARILALAGVSGTIAEGKRANVMLLRSSPLEDLGALRQPIGVAVDGRWYGPEALAKIRKGL